MTEKMRIKILDLGYMTFYKRELVQTEQAEALIMSPAVAVLIDHPVLGYVLYDTGNDDAWEHTYSAQMKQTYPITKLITIASALKQEGLTVDDINYLIVSHLHFDHAGGLKYFADTKAGNHVLVSAAELKDIRALLAQSEEQVSGAYIGSLFFNVSGINFIPIEDTLELGQGVTIFVQKCHTAGLLGLRIALQNRTVIFTGDTVYTEEAYEKALPPGGAINQTNDEFFDHLTELKKMQQQHQAEIFFGHDFAQARAWQAEGWME